MAQYQFNSELLNLPSNDTNSFDQSGAGVIIGGGVGASTPIPMPTCRTISFNLNSSPAGASIFVDEIDTKFTTPHTLQFKETELLTPKVITVKTPNRTSNENYVISAELVEQIFGGTGGSGDGAGGSGGGGGGIGSSGELITREFNVNTNVERVVDGNLVDRRNIK